MARTFFVPIITAASTTAVPALRITSGAGVSSPTNGDIWNAGGALKGRVTGGTGTFAFSDLPTVYIANADFINAVFNAEDMRILSVIMGAY